MRSALGLHASMLTCQNCVTQTLQQDPERTHFHGHGLSPAVSQAKRCHYAVKMQTLPELASYNMTLCQELLHGWCDRV